MRIRVLGCSGGIGAGARTTCLLVDDDTLIDAGTGLGDLELDELRRVRHVFLTHAHLDHIAGLPLFVDTAFDSLVDEPLSVYGRAETLEALDSFIFNGHIWPDFALLPDADNPVLRYVPVNIDETIAVDGRSVRVVDVHHSVPAVGYCLEENGRVLAFSGDTMTNETLWPVLNRYPKLDVLVIEVSFPESQKNLAITSRHYCPSMMVDDLAKLRHDPQIWLTGMKPGEEDLIYREVLERLDGRGVRMLRAGTVFEL